MKNAFLFLLIAVTLYQSCHAQTVIGFWEVTEVTVGKEVKTPVAKWTKINLDGSYQSGNGWLQNSEGTWNFENSTRSYTPAETNGIIDPYGPFKVSFKNQNMIWEREEDGSPVIVTLRKAAALPRSTADKLVGVWDLANLTKNNSSEIEEYDPDDKHYIFIRWDRIYVERTPTGSRATGFWHIDGHKPEVTFISHDESQKHERWHVEVKDQELKMTGISETNKNVEKVYRRIKDFPK